MTRARIHGLLIWLPLLLWLAVEVYVLVAGLLTSCVPQPGGDRAETGLVLLFLGFPGSIVPALVLAKLRDHIDPCRTTGYAVAWFAYCSVGLVQWYFVLRAIVWARAKLYRRFRLAV